VSLKIEKGYKTSNHSDVTSNHSDVRDLKKHVTCRFPGTARALTCATSLSHLRLISQHPLL